MRVMKAPDTLPLPSRGQRVLGTANSPASIKPLRMSKTSNRLWRREPPAT